MTYPNECVLLLILHQASPSESKWTTALLQALPWSLWNDVAFNQASNASLSRWTSKYYKSRHAARRRNGNNECNRRGQLQRIQNSLVTGWGGGGMGSTCAQGKAHCHKYRRTSPSCTPPPPLDLPPGDTCQKRGSLLDLGVEKWGGMCPYAFLEDQPLMFKY